MAIVSDPSASSVVLPVSGAVPATGLADDADEQSGTTAVGGDEDTLSLSSTAIAATSAAQGSAAVAPASEDAAASGDEESETVNLTPTPAETLEEDAAAASGEAGGVSLTPTADAALEETTDVALTEDDDPTAPAGTALGDDDDSGATVFDTVDVEA